MRPLFSYSNYFILPTQLRVDDRPTYAAGVYGDLNTSRSITWSRLQDVSSPFVLTLRFFFWTRVETVSEKFLYNWHRVPLGHFYEKIVRSSILQGYYEIFERARLGYCYQNRTYLSMTGMRGIAAIVTRYCKIAVANPPYPTENPAAFIAPACIGHCAVK